MVIHIQTCMLYNVYFYIYLLNILYKICISIQKGNIYIYMTDYGILWLQTGHCMVVIVCVCVCFQCYLQQSCCVAIFSKVKHSLLYGGLGVYGSKQSSKQQNSQVLTLDDETEQKGKTNEQTKHSQYLKSSQEDTLQKTVALSLPISVTL